MSEGLDHVGRRCGLCLVLSRYTGGEGIIERNSKESTTIIVLVLAGSLVGLFLILRGKDVSTSTTKLSRAD